MAAPVHDPVELSAALIRQPSVTPVDAGVLAVLEGALTPLGFTCHRLPFTQDGTPDVDNLYARLGTAAPNFCFAGHTDVVPPGDVADWAYDPFQPTVRDGRLYGRGAADMKCAIAAFVAATSRIVERYGPDLPGSISLLITGDEEGPAINGTVKMLDWLAANDETLDACMVGEPTNPAALGDMIKIGRRGSINATITVFGTQGHVAYPALADNPVPRLLAFLKVVDDHVFDEGTEHFPPTNLEITTMDVGNATTNLIPAKATARLNIRFNDRHTGASLAAYLEEVRTATAGESTLDVSISGEAFLTPPGTLSELVAGAVHAVTGRAPALSTDGGTSDARFIKDHCAVVELGLVNETAHKVDENSRLDDVRALTDIYEQILTGYFRLAG
ncbi:MAG: succinyl-diaminopimelate desuccinylase [Rhodospirillaceae bacterium]